MKLNQIFDLLQGHQITDGELYVTEGNIPVLTGRNQIKGYWNKSIIKENNLPCITYPTKGNSGNVYVQSKIFDANNTAILILKKEWKNKIDLEWMAHKLRIIFLKVQTSKGGVSYLNKEIVEEIEFDIPSKDAQIKEKNRINELLSIKENIEKILKKIRRIKSSIITIECENYQGKQIPVNKLFKAISGNSGLTEKYLYSVMLDNEEKKYKVLTGSIDVQNTQIIHLCPHPKDSSKKITIWSGEGIHVVRKGKAGHIRHLPYYNYTLNDDAYILAKKKDCGFDLSLKWIVCVYQHLFLEYSSSADNGTWNKTGFFKYATLDIPSIDEQNKVVSQFEEINSYEEELDDIQGKILDILTREPIA